jgi:hypothetical protein
MVHNHPSGKLVASSQDFALLDNISEMFDGDVVQPGIIMDTTSGKYGIFGAEEGVTTERVRPKEGGEIPLDVLRFDKQVFAPDFDLSSLSNIRSAEDVASLVSSQRLGDCDKISFLVLSNSSNVMANIHTTHSNLTKNNIEALAKQMANDAVRFAGTRVIVYGDFASGIESIKRLNARISDLSGKSVKLLDLIKIRDGNYDSASEDGFLDEPEPKYGPQGVGEPVSLSDEESAIIKTSKQDGTYMKAPNGKPTKLNEKQWAQVRTKAFKDWFGDWEKSARIEKLKNSAPVEISGNEYRGKYELTRESAQRYILDNVRGKYKIEDTGEVVEIAKKGAKKVTAHSQGDEAHMKSIAAIPELIKNAIFIEERPAYKEEAQYESYRYYVTGLKIGGEDYTARITIGVKNGKYYYDHYLTEIEKGNLVKVAQGFKPTEDNALPSFAKGKDKTLWSIMQIDNSKVLDENGEPFVVYHGTRGDFTEFDDEKIGSNLDYGTAGKGYYFTTDRQNAENIARNAKGDGEPRVIEAYLNISNPKRNVGTMELDSSDKKATKFTDKAKADGYDGIEATSGYGISKLHWFVAFDKNQIKSATGNNGGFSGRSNDIRFRFIGERGAERLDKAEEATMRIDNLNVAREEQIFLQEGTVASEMGSKVPRRMREIKEALKDADLDNNQRAVVDAFTGDKDNTRLTVEREGGKHTVIMRQGSEGGAGTKHSLYRHYGTTRSYITPEDILLIPNIIKGGERLTNADDPKRIVYTAMINNVDYIVVTDKTGKTESFVNFYSKRTPSDTSTSSPEGNTPEGARRSMEGANRSTSASSNTPEGARSIQVEASKPSYTNSSGPEGNMPEGARRGMEGANLSTSGSSNTLKSARADKVEGAAKVGRSSDTDKLNNSNSDIANGNKPFRPISETEDISNEDRIFINDALERTVYHNPRDYEGNSGKHQTQDSGMQNEANASALRRGQEGDSADTGRGEGTGGVQSEGQGKVGRPDEGTTEVDSNVRFSIRKPQRREGETLGSFAKRMKAYEEKLEAKKASREIENTDGEDKLGEELSDLSMEMMAHPEPVRQSGESDADFSARQSEWEKWNAERRPEIEKRLNEIHKKALEERVIARGKEIDSSSPRDYCYTLYVIPLLLQMFPDRESITDLFAELNVAMMNRLIDDETHFLYIRLAVSSQIHLVHQDVDDVCNQVVAIFRLINLLLDAAL